MNYPVKLEGFEDQTIEVKPGGVLFASQLLVNGRRAPRGPKRNQVLLERSDGTEVIVTWIPQFWGMDVPQLGINGKLINVVEPLKWYVWVWSALPMLLVFLGGFLGAVLGMIAFASNLSIFRTSLGGTLRVVLTAGITTLAAVIYVIAAFQLWGRLIL